MQVLMNPIPHPPLSNPPLLTNAAGIQVETLRRRVKCGETL